MSKLIKTLVLLALTAGLSTSALARTSDEAFDAAQPKAHGPQTTAGLALDDITGVLE